MLNSLQRTIKTYFGIMDYPKNIQKLGLNVSHYGDMVCFWTSSSSVYEWCRIQGFIPTMNREGVTITPQDAAKLGITSTGLWNIPVDSRKKAVKIKD